MHLYRKTLYLGVFLVAAGGTVLIAQTGSLTSDAIVRALGLWPIVPIAIGLALLVRGTRLSLAGGMLAAAVPGLVLGGLIAVAPDLDVRCGMTEPTVSETRDGTFGGSATIDLDLACGDLTVTTAAGSTWRIVTGNDGGPAPVIVANPDRLAVTSAERRVHFGSPWAADTWTVTLPTDVRLDLFGTVDAGRARLDLTGARLGDVILEANAADLRLDLTGATLDRLDLDVNAAAARVTLTAGADDSADYSADFEVNAADLDLCIPAGLGVRIRADSQLGSLGFPGLVRYGDAWETPGYATAASHADVTISVNVGSVDIALEGDCQ